MTYLKLAPYIIIALLVAALIFVSNLYLNKRDEFTAYVAQAKQAAESAKGEQERIEAQRNEALKEIKRHEANLPAVVDNAIAAYRLRYPVKPCNCGVRTDAASKPVDDGASAQCMVADELIKDAAEDALKLTAFQEYCLRNNCPIKE